MATRTEHASRPNRESLRKRLGRVARQIAARDGHACVYCGATEATSGAPLPLDHLTPRSAGGEDKASNLVLACRRHNSMRQDKASNLVLACRRHNSMRQDKPLATFCRIIGIDSRKVRNQARRVLPAV